MSVQLQRETRVETAFLSRFVQYKVFVYASVLGLLVFGLSVQDGAASQEEQAEKTPAVDESGDDENQALKSFAELNETFKDLESQVTELRSKFQTATPEVKQLLLKKYQEISAESVSLLPRLQAAAEREYALNPNEDEAVTKSLVRLILSNVLREQAAPTGSLIRYDGEALRLAQLLSDNDCPESYFKMLTDAPQVANLFSKELINEIMMRRSEVKANLPRVKLTTTRGEIVVELFEDNAPNTVANFIELVNDKYYDGKTFHRVLSNFMAQCGSADNAGGGSTGFTIACECVRENYRRHFTGTLAMAHAGKNTGSAQFYMTFRRTNHLDGKHTVFGRVVSGLDVLNAIKKTDAADINETEFDKIETAVVLRKRDHEYKPTRVPDN